jgi:hypothetical protein
MASVTKLHEGLLHRPRFREKLYNLLGRQETHDQPRNIGKTHHRIEGKIGMLKAHKNVYIFQHQNRTKILNIKLIAQCNKMCTKLKLPSIATTRIYIYPFHAFQ